MLRWLMSTIRLRLPVAATQHLTQSWTGIGRGGALSGSASCSHCITRSNLGLHVGLAARDCVHKSSTGP
eukprot:7827615-Prorocentrum_lima.AAC.1